MKVRGWFFIVLLNFIGVGGCESSPSYAFYVKVVGNGASKITFNGKECTEGLCPFYPESGTLSIQPLGISKYIVAAWDISSDHPEISTDSKFSISSPERGDTVYVVVIDSTSPWMREEFHDLSGWNYTPDNSPGAQMMVSGGYLQVATFGTSSGWVAARIYKPLPQSIDFTRDNFVVAARLYTRCSACTDYGAIGIGLWVQDLSSAGVHGAWYQRNPGGYGHDIGLIAVDTDITLIGCDAKNVNDEMQIVKAGDLYINILRLSSGSEYAYVLPSTSPPTAHNLRVNINTYKTKPTCSMKIDYIRIWRF